MPKCRSLLLASVAAMLATVSYGAYAAGESAGSSAQTATCPRAQITDVWLNNRLSCLSVGQVFIDLSASAAGVRKDTAFIFREKPLDERFHNILGSDIGRHFKYFLCVRNAPANLQRQMLAGDLLTALGMNNFGSLKPQGISSVILEIAGTRQPGYINIPCDPSRHPLIVNYDTGRIESLNPKALSVLETYDE